MKLFSISYNLLTGYLICHIIYDMALKFVFYQMSGWLKGIERWAVIAEGRSSNPTGDRGICYRGWMPDTSRQRLLLGAKACLDAKKS